MSTTLSSSDTGFRTRARRPARPASAPSVAYLAERAEGGAAALFLAALDGSGARALFGGEASAKTVMSFAWSPDRKTLAALVRGGDERAAGLHLVDRATGAERSVSIDLERPGDVRDFAWSEDGARIELVAADAGGAHLVLMTAVIAEGVAHATDATTPDGHRIVEVCEGHAAEGGETLARRSPDGTRLAFVADADAPGRFDLCLKEPGSPERRHVSAGLAVGDCVEAFDWTPDGLRLVFVVAHAESGARSLHAARADGSGDVLELAFGVVPHSPHAPAFRLADAGATVVFRGEVGCSERHALFAVPAAGGAVRELSSCEAGHRGRILDYLPG